MSRMKKFFISILCLADLVFAENFDAKNYFNLPAPDVKGKVSLEQTLAKRRSIREYRDEKLTIKELGQLLWAAQGITANWGGRTSPSAGATYPLEIYVAAGNVEMLEPGVYHYIPEYHRIERVLNQDIRNKLCIAALGQKPIEKAPATIIIAANFSRTKKRYGERATRYVYMEVGHAGQNVYLQAEALGLGTVAIGAFDDGQIKDILKIKEDVLYLFPVGKKF
ncbi:MAG: SagB/ThcOx family dehydrogenase [bacterium]|nr:SagB/ThcOx family dehydrogenase [bacterium]